MKIFKTSYGLGTMLALFAFIVVPFFSIDLNLIFGLSIIILAIVFSRTQGFTRLPRLFIAFIDIAYFFLAYDLLVGSSFLIGFGKFYSYQGELLAQYSSKQFIDVRVGKLNLALYVGYLYIIIFFSLRMQSVRDLVSGDFLNFKIVILGLELPYKKLPNKPDWVAFTFFCWLSTGSIIMYVITPMFGYIHYLDNAIYSNMDILQTALFIASGNILAVLLFCYYLGYRQNNKKKNLQ